MSCALLQVRRRRGRGLQLLLAAAALLVALLALPALGSAASASIQAENALPGTPGWRYSDAPWGTTAEQYAGTVTSIYGYTAEQSAAPGGQVQLHVSTAPGLRYRVEVFRMGWYGGVGARRVACLPSCAGDRAGVEQPAPPPPDPATGLVRAGWSVTDTIAVGPDWVSGYYVAQLVLTSGPNAGTARWVVFIVRPPAGSTSKVLVQVPVNTWLSYNGWGGKSLYDNKSTNGQRGNHVSFERPYWAGQYHFFDHEYQLVRFLEREGHDLGYVTDVDIHRNPAQIRDHRLLMLAGHGEYWTRSMRDQADAAVAAGVNLASMGANTAYWQVRYEDSEHTMVGYKTTADPTPNPADDTIRFRDLGRPECQLLGVQYENSWSVDGADRGYAPATSALSDPWLQGTGFTAGGAPAPNTVGYEWDLITPGCQHPPLTPLLHWDDGPGGVPPADAVRYTAPSGARVFSSGSMQFAWGLDSWRDGYTSTQDARLMAFMRKVMADLTAGGPPPPPRPPPAPPTPQLAPSASTVLSEAPACTRVGLATTILGGRRAARGRVAAIKVRVANASPTAAAQGVVAAVRLPAGFSPAGKQRGLGLTNGRVTAALGVIGPGAVKAVTIRLRAGRRARLGPKRSSVAVAASCGSAARPAALTLTLAAR